MPKAIDLDKPLRTDSAELRSWQSQQFYGARIKVLRDRLSPANVERFNALTYAEKCQVIAVLVSRGDLI